MNERAHRSIQFSKIIIMFLTSAYHVIVGNMFDIVRNFISLDDDSDEDDDHLKIFGKYAVDVDYNRFGYCILCNTRIDEFGYCACSGGAAD
ncbi:MAG TPA: hypothetical protein VIY98_13840 [Nitrososphaeraceae archaeon]